MSLFKNISKELKIFFFIVASKSLFKGMSLEEFRKELENFKNHEHYLKFKKIHQKLASNNIITADELEYLIEYQRKQQWDKF